MSARADFLVRQIRRELARKASPSFARSVQRFFKGEVKTYGWRTKALRKLAARYRKTILEEEDEGLLAEVAENLFAGEAVEEATLGVVLLERSVKKYGPREFRWLEKWLPEVREWSGCDGLCCALLGPLVVAYPELLKRVASWSKSRGVWHRRAAAVALVPAARRGLYTKELLELAGKLLGDQEDMVQKGVGWLLREAGKNRPTQGKVVSWLLGVRKRAPRKVLRIACETLPGRQRKRILALPNTPVSSLTRPLAAPIGSGAHPMAVRVDATRLNP